MTTQNAINANASHPLATVNGGSGISSPSAHGILISEGASAYNPIVLTAGQILVGTTASDPAATTLTAGSGISITSASGAITIANTSTGEVWTDVTATTQTVAANNSYTASNAGAVTFTLPTTIAYGSITEITTGTTAGGWVVAQNAGQSIVFGDVTTTVGTGGSISSTSKGDTIRLLCTVANTTFQVLASVGNITYV